MSLMPVFLTREVIDKAQVVLGAGAIPCLAVGARRPLTPTLSPKENSFVVWIRGGERENPKARSGKTAHTSQPQAFQHSRD